MQMKRRNETEWKYCRADSAEFRWNLGILKLVYTFLHLITVYDSNDNDDDDDDDDDNNNIIFVVNSLLKLWPWWKMICLNLCVPFNMIPQLQWLIQQMLSKNLSRLELVLDSPNH